MIDEDRVRKILNGAGERLTAQRKRELAEEREIADAETRARLDRMLGGMKVDGKQDKDDAEECDGCVLG